MQYSFVDGYWSTLQGLLDWFEVDLGFTELSFIQTNDCGMSRVARCAEQRVAV